MTARGRPPKPTHLKVLQGKPGHRPLNEDEPQPDVVDETPEPPKHLSGVARAEWERAYPMLARNRLITEADLTAFAAYCQAYGRWQEAEHMIAKQGLVVLTPNGFPVQHPYLAIANKAIEQVHKFLTEFGMTPSSRSRVSTASVVGGAGAKKNKFRELASGASSSKAKRSA
jgi:P27 family predicted phage terminase small subunit